MTDFTDHDKVRLLVGDTDSTDPQLFDEEVDTFIEMRTATDPSGEEIVNVNAAAADCAGAIASKYAREFDFSEDGQNFARAQRVGHYMALEQELRNRSGGYTVATGGTATTS